MYLGLVLLLNKSSQKITEVAEQGMTKINGRWYIDQLRINQQGSYKSE